MNKHDMQQALARLGEVAMMRPKTAAAYYMRII